MRSDTRAEMAIDQVEGIGKPNLKLRLLFAGIASTKFTVFYFLGPRTNLEDIHVLTAGKKGAPHRVLCGHARASSARQRRSA